MQAQLARSLALNFVSWSLFWASPALAWNPTGHALVVQTAYNNLTVPAWQAFIALLKQHPRFKTDFLDQIPAAVANGSSADREQWLFRQSGPWPDRARQYGWWLRYRFNAPQWHFINYPIGVEGAGVEPAQGVPKRGWWGRLSRDMNAVQAAQAHVAIARDASQSAADRVLSLTWLCLIVGDLHQPLHTTTLFTAKRFRDGDRGGNKILIAGQGGIRNLHALWDGLAGRGNNNRTLKRRAEELEARFTASAFPASHSTDVEVWVQESVFLSRNRAYETAILNHVNSHEQTRGTLPPLQATEDYIDMAREVVERRIALAGYRLAAVLSDVLASDSVRRVD